MNIHEVHFVLVGSVHKVSRKCRDKIHVQILCGTWLYSVFVEI